MYSLCFFHAPFIRRRTRYPDAPSAPPSHPPTINHPLKRWVRLRCAFVRWCDCLPSILHSRITRQITIFVGPSCGKDLKISSIMWPQIKASGLRQRWLFCCLRTFLFCYSPSFTITAFLSFICSVLMVDGWMWRGEGLANKRTSIIPVGDEHTQALHPPE